MGATLENPYAGLARQSVAWLKGNLHTHSTASDGSRTPQQVVDAYAARGYQFLALTDHDILADYDGVDSRGMVLIRGNEVSMAGNHILHLGASTLVEPHVDRQRVLDDIARDGGLAVINHPNSGADFDHCSYALLTKLKGYQALEIFNGYALGNWAYAFDKWDRLLSSGVRAWGMANDDAHIPAHDARGWNVVCVAQHERNPAGVLAALRSGRFYASTGVAIEQVRSEGAELFVRAENAHAIEFLGDCGGRLALVESREARFDAARVNSTYVRARCIGMADRCAWTQPFFVRDGVAEQNRKLTLEKPLLHALRLPRAPELNADAPEAAWQRAQAATQFQNTGEAVAPPVETSIRCIVSPDDISFLIRCGEPQPERIRRRVERDGEPRTWTDDSVELFLAPRGPGTGSGYFHIVLNATGRLCIRSADPELAALAAGLNCRCAASIGHDHWTVQLNIPLAAFKPALHASGTRWGFHACRNRWHASQHYFWAHVGRNNHNPAAYGWLTLG